MWIHKPTGLLHHVPTYPGQARTLTRMLPARGWDLESIWASAMTPNPVPTPAPLPLFPICLELQAQASSGAPGQTCRPLCPSQYFPDYPQTPQTLALTCLKTSTAESLTLPGGFPQNSGGWMLIPRLSVHSRHSQGAPFSRTTMFSQAASIPGTSILPGITTLPSQHFWPQWLTVRPLASRPASQITHCFSALLI